MKFETIYRRLFCYVVGVHSLYFEIFNAQGTITIVLCVSYILFHIRLLQRHVQTSKTEGNDTIKHL